MPSHQHLRFLPEIEAELARLQAAWPAAIALRCDKYSHFCWMPLRFAPAFPKVNEAELRALTLFCHLYVGAALLQDHLLDETCPRAEVGVSAMRVMAQETEANRILQRLFPPSSRFWSRHHGYLAEHARAFVDEQEFRHRRRPLSEYTEPVALAAAAAKIGLARIVIAALVELEGDDRWLQPICDALAATGEAMGMLDDVTDWKDDLRKGQPSLLLSRALIALPDPLDEGGWTALQPHVSRALHYGGHTSHVLQLALGALDRADQLEQALPGLPWYEHTHALRGACQTALAEVALAVRQGVDQSLRRARPGESPARAPEATKTLVRPWRITLPDPAV